MLGALRLPVMNYLRSFDTLSYIALLAFAGYLALPLFL